MAAAPRYRSRPAATRWRSPPPAWRRIFARCWRLPPTSRGIRALPTTKSRRGATNLITSIRQEEDDPASMAGDAFMRGALRRASLRAPGARHHRRRSKRFAARTWCASTSRASIRPAITVIVVGDVEEEAAIAAVSKLFGDWSAGVRAQPLRRGRQAAAVDRAGRRRRRPSASWSSVPMMNKAQADVVYGFVGIRRSDPDYTALGDEQRARPVRDRRPARRQHPRAAGHGVLRVQLARRRRSARAR